jgi:hypothetical protein
MTEVTQLLIGLAEIAGVVGLIVIASRVGHWLERGKDSSCPEAPTRTTG